MCGIVGVWNLTNKPVNYSLLKDITDVLRHRGPDDEGYVLLNSNNGDHKELIGKDSIWLLVIEGSQSLTFLLWHISQCQMRINRGG